MIVERLRWKSFNAFGRNARVRVHAAANIFFLSAFFSSIHKFACCIHCPIVFYPVFFQRERMKDAISAC